MLIISQDWAIQNVVEQVCMTCGYPSIVVGTVPEAEAKLAQLGDQAFALTIIDTGALGEGGTDTQGEARQLLQTWTGRYPRLPVVFIGTALQKYAILAARPALVPFVTIPFSPHDLMQIVQPLLPEVSQRPISPIQTSSPDRSHGGGRLHEPPSDASPPCGL